MFYSAPELCSALSAVGSPPCAPYMPASYLKYLGFLKRFCILCLFSWKTVITAVIPFEVLFCVHKKAIILHTHKLDSKVITVTISLRQILDFFKFIVSNFMRLSFCH